MYKNAVYMLFFMYLCLRIMHTSINIGGKLLTLDEPIVMGIVNVTPDSFYESCKNITECNVLAYAARALQEGATILDIGGYSTRPHAAEVSLEDEWQRVAGALRWIRRTFPNAIISIDTFRSEIARRAVTEYGVQIVNDISGGAADEKMFQTVADLQVPYILMHMRGTPQTMQSQTNYTHLLAEIIDYFQQKVNQLHRLGVRDIMLDPGFGFAKTLEQNYELLHKLHYLQILDLPLLVGISRKSMVYKALDINANEALNGTTALHILALQQGAKILRVHDVREAHEAIQLYQKTIQTN